MLEAMGRELAAIHLGTGDVGGAVRADLAARGGTWLAAAARRAAEDVRSEHRAFRDHWHRRTGGR
jgi:hypothetical protein